MNFNLEYIDELRKRANVSYEDAKAALERFDGSMVDALIYLEKNQKLRAWGRGHHEHDHHHGHHWGGGDFFKQVKEVWKKGNSIRLIVSKQEKALMNVPLAIALLVAVCTAKFSIAILMLSLILGCRYRIQNSAHEAKINETLDKVHEQVDVFKKKFTEQA